MLDQELDAGEYCTECLPQHGTKTSSCLGGGAQAQVKSLGTAGDVRKECSTLCRRLLAPVLRSRAMLQELEVKFRSSEGVSRSQSCPGSGALADLISSLACSNCLACTSSRLHSASSLAQPCTALLCTDVPQHAFSKELQHWTPSLRGTHIYCMGESDSLRQSRPRWCCQGPLEPTGCSVFACPRHPMSACSTFDFRETVCL